MWPANDYFDCEKVDHISFGVGRKCTGWRRVDSDIQRKHELKVNVKFKNIIWLTSDDTIEGNSIVNFLNYLLRSLKSKLFRYDLHSQRSQSKQ